MSYIKLFNEKMQVVGAANANENLPQSNQPLFVKLYNDKLMPLGVQQVNTPAEPQNPALPLFGLPDGVYAIGTNGVIVEFRRDTERVISVTPIIKRDEEAQVEDAYYYPSFDTQTESVVRSAVFPNSFTVDEVINMEDELLAFVDDVLRASLHLTQCDENIAMTPSRNVIVVDEVNRQMVDYAISVDSKYLYPSFNGFLALVFPQQQGVEGNWVFKVTQDKDWNVTIQLAVNGNNIWIYNNIYANIELFPITESTPPIEEILIVIDDIFRQFYMGVIDDRGGAVVTSNELLNTIPTIMWAITL